MICSRTFGLGVCSLACLGMLAMSSHRSPAADDKPAAPLRHVVLFKFKPEVTKPQVQEVVEAFAALPKKIDTIAAILKAGRSGDKGQIGDGKIFVLPMDDCVRIRTGERGREAI